MVKRAMKAIVPVEHEPEAELILITCPACGAEPFTPFLRGRFKRSIWSWAGLRSILCWRPFQDNAVICSDCQRIVGWE